NTLAAINKEDDKVVVVYTNDTDSEQMIDFDLSGFESVGDAATAIPYVTAEKVNLTQKEEIDIDEENLVLSATVDSESVTTFVISDVAGVDDSFLDEDSGYKLFNADSDLVLDKDDDSLVQNKN